MGQYLLRRLAQSVVVVLGVTIIIFALLHAFPSGSIARSILGSRASPDSIAAFTKEYGLNQPVYYQYWRFLDQLLHGNLGTSFRLNQTVTSLIEAEFPKDLALGGLALVLSLVIAIPVGVAQAVKRNQAGDHLATGVSFILYSMPTYALGFILIQALAISFHVFPAEAPQSATALGMLEDPRALVLPVLTLTLVTYAQFTRYMRSSAIETLAQDWIRTARAKGIPERLVLWRHVIRNSLLTTVTMVGLSLPVVITGTLIVEQVYNFPGLGLEYFNAAQANDYQVMLGITVIIGLVTVLGNLLADVSYAILDPRIRH